MIYRSILKVVEEYQYVEAWIEIRNQEKKGIVGGLDWFKSDYVKLIKQVERI